MVSIRTSTKSNVNLTKTNASATESKRRSPATTPEHNEGGEIEVGTLGGHLCRGLEKPRRGAVAGVNVGAGYGLGVGLHMQLHLLLRHAPAKEGGERRGFREQPRRGLVPRGEEAAREGPGVGRRLMPHLRLRCVPALEGTHEQRVHGGGRRVRLGFDHAVARRGAVAGGSVGLWGAQHGLNSNFDEARNGERENGDGVHHSVLQAYIQQARNALGLV